MWKVEETIEEMVRLDFEAYMCVYRVTVVD